MNLKGEIAQLIEQERDTIEEETKGGDLYWALSNWEGNCWSKWEPRSDLVGSEPAIALQR